jgi:hypothetical protein
LATSALSFLSKQWLTRDVLHAAVGGLLFLCQLAVGYVWLSNVWCPLPFTLPASCNASPARLGPPVILKIGFLSIDDDDDGGLCRAVFDKEDVTRAWRMMKSKMAWVKKKNELAAYHTAVGGGSAAAMQGALHRPSMTVPSIPTLQAVDGFVLK